MSESRVQRTESAGVIRTRLWIVHLASLGIFFVPFTPQLLVVHGDRLFRARVRLGSGLAPLLRAPRVQDLGAPPVHAGRAVGRRRPARAAVVGGHAPPAPQDLRHRGRPPFAGAKEGKVIKAMSELLSEMAETVDSIDEDVTHAYDRDQRPERRAGRP